LLLTGQTAEARSIGAELLELAVRLDPSKLYTVLDAMAFLAYSSGRYEAAARIACCADSAYGAHGQDSRRPTDERMRDAVEKALEATLGATWRAAGDNRLVDEAAACSLALGLDA
jgi:hypothetical protein